MNDNRTPIAVTIFARASFAAVILLFISIVIHTSIATYAGAVAVYTIIVALEERGKLRNEKRKNDDPPQDPFYPDVPVRESYE